MMISILVIGYTATCTITTVGVPIVAQLHLAHDSRAPVAACAQFHLGCWVDYQFVSGSFAPMVNTFIAVISNKLGYLSLVTPFLQACLTGRSDGITS